MAKEREGLEACFEASHSKFEFDMIHTYQGATMVYSATKVKMIP